jgi:NAD(P)-dependent dehydrogenase (short-subunit alcohol dehydrogenase family)
MEIEGRVVVVTGGGSGIGAALARAAAAAGAAHVVVADLDQDKAAAVAHAIGGTAAEVDVADEAAVVDLVRRVERAHGPIGVFASNAGFLTVAGIEESNERIDAMWDVHVMAHIFAARAVIPSMAANGGGHLLQTASAAGLLTQVGSMAYSVTKAATVALAQWLSVAHHHQGIGVSVLCPQGVRTDIFANSPDTSSGSLSWDRPNVASGDGVAEPDDVAAACLDAIREERFLVLPHPEVADYMQRRAADPDRWLRGMRRVQDAAYAGRPLPGDAILPPT